MKGPNTDNYSSYYEILGIKASASKEEIKQAYKDLLNVWNPDRFADDPSLQQKAREKIKEIDDAYEKLILHSAKNSSQASPSQDRSSKSGDGRVKVGFFSWLLWPPIFDRNSARGVAKRGVYISIYFVIVNVIWFIWEHGRGGARLALVDVIAYSIIAFGIYKMSRVASVVGLSAYIFTTVITDFIIAVDKWSKHPAVWHIGRFIPILAFILMYINAIRGTFAYERYSFKNPLRQ